MKTKLISLLIISAALVCNAAFAESGYIQHVRKNAEAGQAWAEKSMGDAFYFGIDMEVNSNEDMEANQKKAFEWYRKAAKQGDSTAMHAVGRAYYFAEGVEGNYKKAAEWYRKAANKGDVESLYFLARMYDYGIGVKKDISKAEDLYLKTIVEYSYEESLYSLAQMYFENSDFERKRSIFMLLSMAADIAGNKAAENDLDEFNFWGNLSPAQQKIFSDAKDVEYFTFYQILGGLTDKARKNAVSGISARVAITESVSELLSTEEIYNRIWPSVVYIQIESIDGIGSGSGVIVQPNIVATNCHVVKGADTILVLQPKESSGTENKVFMTSGYEHSKNGKDYCLLYVPDLLGSGVPATIRPYDTLRVGETVYALGAPDGEILSLSKGIISQLRNDPSEGLVIQSDVDIAGGSSGGGLFDSAGNLIGHTTFSSVDEREIDFEGLEFSVPADIVLEFE